MIIFIETIIEVKQKKLENVWISTYINSGLFSKQNVVSGRDFCV